MSRKSDRDHLTHAASDLCRWEIPSLRNAHDQRGWLQDRHLGSVNIRGDDADDGQQLNRSWNSRPATRTDSLRLDSAREPARATSATRHEQSSGKGQAVLKTIGAWILH